MRKFATGKKSLRMKKFILLSIIMVAISVANCNVGFAQTDNNRYEIRSHKSVSPMVRNTREASSCAGWGTFTNFSATDMNGVTHDIQSYLDQGKFVVVEFFCAWSPPDWTYHQTGLLESLYNTYGDGGSEEFIVLMIEVELSNTEAQITGTTTGQTQTGVSQGDFTNGGTNPVPIINATENLSIWVSLYEGSVPSVYLFCPSGYVHDIYDQEYYTTNAIYNFATSFCPDEESLPNIDVTKPDVVHAGEPASFSSCVVSLTDVTYAWTFEDGTPETSTDANVDVVWNTPGMHRISLTVTNENGPIEFPDSVDVMDCSSGISTFPFVEDFENGQGCWNFISANTENEDLFGLKEYEEGMHGAVFSSYNNADNYNQYIISPQLRHAYELKLSFKYKKYNDSSNQSTGENFYVKYSTTTSDTSNFIMLGSMITANSNSWETYTRTLPADAKYFMINYNSDYQYCLLIDDLTIESAVHWSCDFEDEEMWTFGNDQQNGNVQWQIVTPETFPSNLISGTNAYFNPFVFQGDTLNETPGHWAMVELISQLTDLGGPGQVAESPWIEFSGIDLSEAQHPKITFRQMFRQLNGIETIVMVSADGQTWTEHNLNEEVESNQYGQNTITKGVNIYEAAGAENVTIRFLVNSDASVSQMGYGWQIDDIKILEAPACDLTLNAARISMFGYVDYRNLPDDFNPDGDESSRIDYAYQFYDPYAQSPRQQWFTQNGFAAFNIEVVNNGYDTITPKARVKVFNPNGDLIYDKIAEGTFALQSDQSDTLDLARNTGDMENSTVFRFYVDSEDEIAPGRYNVEFEILTDDRDEDNTDNYSTQYFYITDSRYSPSYDQPNGYFWPSNYGTEVGTYFTYYYEPDRDVKVDAYIDAHTTAETQLQAIVYMYNNEEYTQVLSSDIVNITEDMLGSWVNFSFNGAFNVTFDEGQNSVEYLITIKTIEGTLAIGSYNLLTNKGKRTRIKNGDTWYYLGKNAAIRLREFEYAITVESSNTEYGTVSGSGEYDDGSEVIITATPNQGYRFVSWNDENTDNPRSVTVTSDSTFVANFAINIYSDIQAKFYADADATTEVGSTMTIFTNEDFVIYPALYNAGPDVAADTVIVDVQVNGSSLLQNIQSLPLAEAPLEVDNFYFLFEGNSLAFTAAELDQAGLSTFDLCFIADYNGNDPDTENNTVCVTVIRLHQYTITALPNNEAYGSVSGGGTYEEGTDIVITAMPNGGYLFDSWEDGNFDNPRSVTVTSDSTFVADFVKCEITQTIDTVAPNFITVGDHTFYSTGRYSFEIQHEADCDTIFDINLTVLAEPEPFDIGPNPTEKILNIKSDGFISHVEFYSPTGQLALRKEVNGNFAECDVENLVSGIYIVRIYGDESNLPSVYKIVKE